MLLYSTLLCNKIARALGGSKKCEPTKRGGSKQNRSKNLIGFDFNKNTRFIVIFYLFVPLPLYAMLPQIQSTCHCMANHYIKKMAHASEGGGVRWVKIMCWWGGGGCLNFPRRPEHINLTEHLFIFLWMFFGLYPSLVHAIMIHHAMTCALLLEGA